MYDETQMKIINATMNLIMEQGYSGATTKNIAKMAGVNECTIFRRFEGKKDIVLVAMGLPEWNPGLSESDFIACDDVRDSLISFSEVYMHKVTPRMVKISIGLRTPELTDVTVPGIMKVPETFKKVLVNYFQDLIDQRELKACDVKALAIQFISMIFGFVFFNVSFGNKLTGISKKDYIRNSVDIFVRGIGILE